MICFLSSPLRIRAIVPVLQPSISLLLFKINSVTLRPLFILVFFFITAYTQAQTGEVQKNNVSQRQYIVLTTKDTLDVEFIPPSPGVPYGDSLWLQNHIIIKEKNKQRELPMEEIMSYEYKGIVRETISLVKDSKVIPFIIEYKCCKRIVYGPISLFECYEIEPGFRDPSVNVVATKLFYKRDDTFKPSMFLNFNKGMSKVVKDYPELSVRVKNGEFERKDIAIVLTEYNAWMQSKR